MIVRDHATKPILDAREAAYSDGVQWAQDAWRGPRNSGNWPIGSDAPRPANDMATLTGDAREDAYAAAVYHAQNAWRKRPVS